jgi:glc operon protein GlcG
METSMSIRIRTSMAALLVFTLLGGVNGSAAAGAERRILTLEDARRVAGAAAAEARRNNASGAIAIVDDGGHLVYFERLEGTFPAGAPVSIGKARTAATFRRPTKDFEEAIRNGRGSLLGVMEMTPLQGGVPLIADGQVVGAIGISGAASAQQDEEIARAAAAAYK